MKKTFTTFAALAVIFCLTFELPAQNAEQFIERSNTAKRTLEIIDDNREASAQFLAEIGAIISPSGQEHERAEAVAQRMREIGLSDVYLDESPNAVGVLPGRTDSTIVFISTLDDLAQVAEHQREAGRAPYIEGDRVIGPGTNTSLTTAAMLAAAQALIESGAEPYYTLIFASVAQEEAGLIGMKNLYERYKDLSAGFIDILGEGISITFGALGIHWWRVEAEGPGGHTLSGGMPNVNQALGRAAGRILQLDYPERYAEQRTYINIGMMRSGSVFNHKPSSGWFSLDIRSIDASIIEAIEMDVQEILETVADETGITLTLEEEVLVPGGQIPGARESRLVRHSTAISRYLGNDPVLSEAGSSNMNVAVHHGSPAIGLGGSRGGSRGQADEWASIPALINTARHVALLGLMLGD